MKTKLQIIAFSVVFFTTGWMQAQSLKLEQRIQKTGTVTEDGVTFNVSSDDAEQENDAIDGLYDDDLDAGWEGAPEDFNTLTVGLRFRDLFIPKGATIDSAFIVISSHEAKNAEDVAELNIWAEAADSAVTFNETDLITNRTKTNAKINWTVNEPWGLWTKHHTPDIKTIIQEVINRPNWKSGNAIALVLQGKNQGASDVENAREIQSFENIADPEDGGDGQNHPDRVPQIVIYYSVKNAMVSRRIMVTDTVVEDGVSLRVSSDDAEQENDAIDGLYDDDLDVGWEGAPEDFNTLTVGLRFRDLFIPKGAIIDSAFIVISSHEAKNAEDVAELNIWAEAVDSAVTFNESDLITNRVTTNAKINWTVNEPWGLWTKHQTPDIKTIIQEIINRPNWKSGNAIALVLEGKNQGASDVENAREIQSFENIADPEDGGDGQNHPDRVPELIIYYSSNGVVSTQKISLVQNLKMYPNPTQNVVNVLLPNNENFTVEFFDLQGKLTQTETNVSGNVLVNVTNLHTGLYLVVAKSNNSIYTNKLFIQK
jgi:hypothetical protein